MTRPGAGPGGGPAVAGQDPPAAAAAPAPGSAQAGAPADDPATSAPPAAAAAAPRRPRRRATPWRAVVLTVLAAVILLGAGWALLGSSLLVVRHVQVTGDYRVTGAQVRAAAGIRPGTPLARLDQTGIAARVGRLAWVRSARVSRSWPDSVVIAVRERVPALAVADGGQFEVVDIGGVVLETSATRPAGLPLLRSAPAELRGSPVVRAAVVVMGELPASVGRRVAAVSAPAADAVTLHLRSGATVRWGGTRRAGAKARELLALLRTRARYYDVSSSQVAVTSG